MDGLTSTQQTESLRSNLGREACQKENLEMPATLDLPLVQGLAHIFPNRPWEAINSQVFIADRGKVLHSDWAPAAHLEGVGGVYAILLPTAWFTPQRTLHLHAPHRHQGVPIPFVFSLEDFTDDGYGVVYVGRTTNLRQRWRGHLTRGERNDGGQVKYGLVDCHIAPDTEAALQRLRARARIIYTPLPGAENCANRDVLEMALCARFGPPFNIKSER